MSRLKDDAGHPEGVAPGTRFGSREELSAARVHLPLVNGVAIHRPRMLDRKASDPQLGPEDFPVATSLVIGAGSSRAPRGERPVVEYRVPCDTDPALVCI